MDSVKRSNKVALPKALRSRGGWAEFLERKRSEEPHLHQIEPTNSCPYSCAMCPRHEKMTRTEGFMDIALFTKVIDEVSTYSVEVREKEIELYHFGESLLHPEIVRMVDYVSSAGLRPTLSINPGELTPELIDDLLASKPYRIIVSLDSTSSEKYKEIRGGHVDLDRAVEMTELLIGRH
ncbi:MAG: radical SAM protein, partial [Thermodesulfobacteriota bacterium]